MNVTDDLSLSVVLRRTDKSGGRDEDTIAPAGALSVQRDEPSTFSTRQWIYGFKGSLKVFDGAWVHKIKANRSSTSLEDFLNDRFFQFQSLFGTESAVNKYQYLNTFKFEGFAFILCTHAPSKLFRLPLNP